MTTISMVAGFLTAIFSGLLAGRCLRSSRAGSAVAFAVAVTAGLLVLHTSRTSDLLRVIQPKTASDWLPLLTILAACCVLIPVHSFRVGCGLILAISIPVRLLWGSIYLPSESFDFIVWLCITTWSAALAFSVLLMKERSIHRISGETMAWSIAVTGTTTTIMMSGSLTYGAMTGICGVAALSVLISTSQIPNIAALPAVCLIGLSGAFSELPVPIAGSLLLAWIGVLFADRMTIPRFVGGLRAAAVSTVIVAVTATFMRQMESQEAGDKSQSAYGSFGSEFSTETRTESAEGQLKSQANRGASPMKFDSPAINFDGSDPFEGLP